MREEKNLSRQVFAYPTPDALAEIYERGAINLFDLPWDSLPDIERLRPYHRKAISEIEGAIRHGKREMLVAMATGTGKTFLTVSQIYRLLEVRAFKRILFLVDRRALAAQAVRELGSFTIPNHAFGLIIADECHRGYTSSETARWREVIQYFDAVRIGLTATPAPHSLTLFKEVVSRYTTDEAIADGWLVDYEPYKISSNVFINGAFLKEGEKVGEIDRERRVKRHTMRSKMSVISHLRKLRRRSQCPTRTERSSGRSPSTRMLMNLLSMEIETETGKKMKVDCSWKTLSGKTSWQGRGDSVSSIFFCMVWMVLSGSAIRFTNPTVESGST